MRRMILSITIILVISFSTVTYGFDDVPENHWAREYIDALASIIPDHSSYHSNIFKPEHSITRAEFVMLILQTFKQDVIKDTEKIFDDVAPNHWYFSYIGTAHELGFIDGIDGNKFNPDANITREEMIVVTMRVYEKLSRKSITDDIQGYEMNFTDKSEISQWAIDYAKEACKIGVIKGLPENRIGASDYGTRAEAAAIIIRTFRLIEKE